MLISVVNATAYAPRSFILNLGGSFFSDSSRAGPREVWTGSSYTDRVRSAGAQ